MIQKLSNKDKSIKLLLSLIPLLVCWIFLAIFIYHNDVIVLTDQNYTSTYTDQEVGGKSQAKVHYADKSAILNYTLREGFDFPYAGVHFSIPEGKLQHLNTPACISIDIKATHGKEIPIILNEQIYVDSNHKSATFRLWQYNLKLDKAKSHYTVPLSDFSVPAWWHKQYPQTEEALPKFDLTKVRGISIQNCILQKTGKQDTLHITSFKLSTDYNLWIYILASASILWIIGSVLYMYTGQRKKSILVPYMTTENGVDKTSDWDVIQFYIASHYMEDLTMENMQQQLGISKNKIGSLIKENTTYIFRQYLNQVRIAEAKRLLVETDLPIGEIADQIGYGHISNFNRVFKEYTGQSPSDHRKDVRI